MTEKNTDWVKETIEIVNSLKVESDRGCVLVVGTMIENVLEEHIAARLIPRPSKDDELMSRSLNSPISTFSAKINLAYRLGLIPLNERKIYHQLRELRNSCAHQIDEQDFEKLHFKDRTSNIIEESQALWKALMATVGPALFPNSQPESVKEFVDMIGWRAAFEVFFSMIIAHKRASTPRVTPILPLYKASNANPQSD